MRLSVAVLVACAIAVLARPVVADQPGPVAPTPPADSAQLYADKPVVELVTMGVGSLIWERHGHIALCIRYENPRQDACYNYGIGEFHKPLQMTWGFFRGTKSFWVGKIRRREMLSIYENADRTIWTQPLPLTPDQKRTLIAKLESDILDENRYYPYDHFWDNCTTRVRDVIDEATGGALRSMTEPAGEQTFRDLAREGFFGMRIPLLVTDAAMGRVTDRVPTYYERMFLPEYLREAVHKKWGIEPIVEYQRTGPPPLSDGPSGRILFALLILVLTAPAWSTRLWGQFQRAGLAVAIVPPALLGTVLWFLAIISPLPYVRWNESCLVLLPFDLAVLFLGAANRQRYARGRLVMLGVIALLMVVGVFTQPIFEVLLWPAVPLAVVGFWPTRAATTSTSASQPAAKKSRRSR